MLLFLGFGTPGGVVHSFDVLSRGKHYVAFSTVGAFYPGAACCYFLVWGNRGYWHRHGAVSCSVVAWLTCLVLSHVMLWLLVPCYPSLTHLLSPLTSYCVPLYCLVLPCHGVGATQPTVLVNGATTSMALVNGANWYRHRRRC